MNDVPTYSGFESDSSGRTRTTRRPRRPGGCVVTVEPSANVSSCRPSPRGRIAVTLRPHWTVRRERVEQDAPQIAAVDLRAPAAAVVGLVEQDRAVLVEHPRRLGAFVDEAGRTGRNRPAALSASCPL